MGWGERGRYVHFVEFVDGGAKGFLDVADAVMGVLVMGRGEGGCWREAYKRAAFSGRGKGQRYDSLVREKRMEVRKRRVGGGLAIFYRVVMFLGAELMWL